MATWIASWPVGTVIAGAVRDEASYHLTEDAVAALRMLGVKVDLRGHFRGSHAFVGVVGAASGAAAEAFAPFGPARIAIGPALDASVVSAGIGKVHFQPEP